MTLAQNPGHICASTFTDFPLNPSAKTCFSLSSIFLHTGSAVTIWAKHCLIYESCTLIRITLVHFLPYFIISLSPTTCKSRYMHARVVVFRQLQEISFPCGCVADTGICSWVVNASPETTTIDREPQPCGNSASKVKPGATPQIGRHVAHTHRTASGCGNKSQSN